MSRDTKESEKLYKMLPLKSRMMIEKLVDHIFSFDAENRLVSCTYYDSNTRGDELQLLKNEHSDMAKSLVRTYIVRVLNHGGRIVLTRLQENGKYVVTAIASDGLDLYVMSEAEARKDFNTQGINVIFSFPNIWDK